MFFKKKILTDTQKLSLIDAVSDMLAIQLDAVRTMIERKMVTCKSSIEDVHGRINRRAIGYIYGFIDSALQSSGQDMSDPSVGVATIYHVMRRLFPGREDTYTQFLIKNARDKSVMAGMMAGGQQFAEYSKPRHKGAPMGLARFIIEGDR